MTEKSEKFLSLDKFKERVYKHIGTLESFDEIESAKNFEAANRGCFGIFAGPLLLKIAFYANREAKRQYRIKRLDKKADEILADREIKALLCEKLDATIVLPIDAAYKLTPVLYALALEDEEKVPFDTMLFAIICRKITMQGVENFCSKSAPKAEKGGKTPEKQ